MKNKKNVIVDKLLLIGTAILGYIVVFSISIPLSKLGISEIWISYVLNAVLLLGLSVYFIFAFLKEEKIRENRYIYILTTLGFYFLYMSLLLIVDRLRIISLEYLIGRAYRAWFTGMVYIFLLISLVDYVVEKFNKRTRKRVKKVKEVLDEGKEEGNSKLFRKEFLDNFLYFFRKPETELERKKEKRKNISILCGTLIGGVVIILVWTKEAVFLGLVLGATAGWIIGALINSVKEKETLPDEK